MARTLRYLFVLLFVGIAGQAFAQGGSISGLVKDDQGEPVIGAVVQALQGGTIKSGMTTDENGNYTIKPLEPGRYDIKVQYVGYKADLTTGVLVSVDKVTDVNVNLEKATNLKEVKVTGYRVPLIDRHKPGNVTTKTAEEIEKMPTRSTEGVALTAPGVLSNPNGGLSLQGARSEGTLYYIDGVQVRGGATTLTQGTVDQITILTSGLPARYGDALGGVISVTSKGPSPKLRGGVTLEHSVDGFNHNLASVNLSGPIYSRKDSTGAKDTRIGFMLGAELWYDEDRRPTYGGNYVLKQDVLQRLQQNPVVGVTTQTGDVNYRSATEFVRAEDFEVQKKRNNAEIMEIRLNSRLDFKLTDQLNLSAGGRFNYVDFTNWQRGWSFFTPDVQPVNKSIEPMGYIRLTQRFGKGNASADGKKPLISNAYYTLQFDYQKNYASQQDPNHKKNLFRYGYVGKFYTDYMSVYAPSTDDSSKRYGVRMIAERVPTRTTFERSELNPVLANYTSSLQNYMGGSFMFAGVSDIPAIRGTSGIINGQLPTSTYGMFANVGNALGGYSYANNDQFAVTVDASFDLQPAKGPKHAIGFGLYYQQRVERSFGVTGARASGTTNMWQYMRQLTNKHIALDYANPVFIVNGQRYSWDRVKNGEIAPSPYDTIVYNRFIPSDTAQSTFDKNLRKKLGLAENSVDYVNVDEYDPDMFSLDMFSADELLNNGNGFVGYQGYTYHGTRQKGQVNFNDFFTDRQNRPIGSYRPNYIAGYVMDNFTFKDLIFNVGVRVDRFDANTKMLKDPYSLYGVNTVGEARSRGDVTLNNSTYAATLGGGTSAANLHPGNIGDDYVVYVNTNSTPNRTVVGYRQGDDWYDPNGKFIEDPRTLTNLYNNGKDIQPLLVNTVQMNDANYDPNTSFTDYKPQVNVMPRISFSFPISDVALFYAHYDVVVQRPDVSMFASPADYYYFNTLGTNLINNPGLKPQRLFDYEVGFQQQLSRSSALTLTAFYKERKDMIQVRPYLYAYPKTYYTYGNRDFSTTKGMTLKYDLRRTGNLRMDIAYTLQFAEGTGSSATSGNGGSGGSYNQGGLLSNFIGASLPNMRYVTFLDYDARHNIVTSIDYRYADNQGPVIGKTHILENAGINFIFRTTSGRPYTRYAQPVGRFVVGGANQSRLPWTYNLDLRLDKDFNLTKVIRRSKEGEAPRSPFIVNAFVLINNVLNTRNIVDVYGYTSSPDDNGFLSHPVGVQEAKTQTDAQSYIDMSTINQMNPGMLAVPRRINVGLNFSF